MNFIPQSAELLSITKDPIFLIERCGRTCYKSEARMACANPRCSNGKVYFHTTGILEDCPDCLERAKTFVSMIIKKGHESVLEHACATMRLITDRGVSHELVRHRIASYSQESTRYCNYEKTDGISVILPSIKMDEHCSKRWEWTMQRIENTYLDLISRGISPQWARSVLPTCLKTEIVITANLREWRHIFKMRISPAAHPQIKELMQCAHLELIKAGVGELFDDLIEKVEKAKEEQR